MSRNTGFDSRPYGPSEVRDLSESLGLSVMPVDRVRPSYGGGEYSSGLDCLFGANSRSSVQESSESQFLGSGSSFTGRLKVADFNCVGVQVPHFLLAGLEHYRLSAEKALVDLEHLRLKTVDVLGEKSYAP